MVVGHCEQDPESCVQKQGQLMVLAVQHFKFPGPKNELEEWFIIVIYNNDYKVQDNI